MTNRPLRLFENGFSILLFPFKNHSQIALKGDSSWLFFILRNSLPFSKEPLCRIVFKGHLHFGPFPKFPRILVWKASLSLFIVLALSFDFLNFSLIFKMSFLTSKFTSVLGSLVSRMLFTKQLVDPCGVWPAGLFLLLPQLPLEAQRHCQRAYSQRGCICCSPVRVHSFSGVANTLLLISLSARPRIKLSRTIWSV